MEDIIIILGYFCLLVVVFGLVDLAGWVVDRREAKRPRRRARAERTGERRV